MSFRRDLEDLGLLAVVLNTNKTNQILENIQNAHLAEVMQKEYVASIEAKHEIAATIKSIDNRLEELKEEPPEASEPVQFLLNNSKLNQLNILYQISKKVISGEQLTEACHTINQVHAKTITDNVVIFSHIFPTVRILNDAKIQKTWETHLTAFGWNILELMLRLDSIKNCFYILNELGKIEKLTRTLPFVELQTSQLTDCLHSIYNRYEYSGIKHIKIDPISSGSITTFDYDNLTKTKSFQNSPYKIHLLMGLLITIQSFVKNETLNELQSCWIKIQTLLGYRCFECDILLNNDRSCSKCKAKIKVDENPLIIPLRIVFTANHGPVILGKTDLLTYSQKLSLIGSHVFRHCFVATAVFEDANHPVVWQLREVRKTMEKHLWGRIISSVYWHLGPFLAEIVKVLPILRYPLRFMLNVFTRLTYPYTSLNRRRNFQLLNPP